MSLTLFRLAVSGCWAFLALTSSTKHEPRDRVECLLKNLFADPDTRRIESLCPCCRPFRDRGEYNLRTCGAMPLARFLVLRRADLCRLH